MASGTERTLRMGVLDAIGAFGLIGSFSMPMESMPASATIRAASKCRRTRKGVLAPTKVREEGPEDSGGSMEARERSEREGKGGWGPESGTIKGPQIRRRSAPVTSVTDA